MPKTVFSVGQCGFDHSSITELCRGYNAKAINIGTLSELQNKLKTETPDLILINRILDRDGSSGIEIVRDLKNDELTKEIPVMLVSNYASAQSEAVALGALPGFGKDNIFSKDTKERISSLL